MSEPFVVVFVAGVTPGKWARVWGERMLRIPLEVRQASDTDALQLLHEGTATIALLRLPIADDGDAGRANRGCAGTEFSIIPLYSETPVVVAPKDHPIAAFDSVTLADLADETMLDGQGADTVELVATGVGVAIMPQAVARVHSRRDVVARQVSDGIETRIALVWVTSRTTTLIEEFVGIVRGRTANSSRGRLADLPEPASAWVPAPARRTNAKPGKPGRSGKPTRKR